MAIRLILFSLIVVASTTLLGQEDKASKLEKSRYLRLMFYNCENFFDTLPNSEYKEYNAGEARNWNAYKFYQKANKVSQVITNVGAWSPVELVGLCEIESIHVLHHLIYNSPLYKHEYQFIHKESPDHRGIDVALLYQPKHFQPIESRFINVSDSSIGLSNTREILYCKGITKHTDTLHIFVNHWPSRWGGQLESENKRMHAAKVLRYHTDSIARQNPQAYIVAMGDFNDDFFNKSINETLLGANEYLTNLVTKRNTEAGSHKYQGSWSTIDQIIASKNLLTDTAKLSIDPVGFNIFSPPFLLESDETFLGIKPFRTYQGYKYQGGYSDHLPIYLDIQRKNQTTSQD